MNDDFREEYKIGKKIMEVLNEQETDFLTLMGGMAIALSTAWAQNKTLTHKESLEMFESYAKAIKGTIIELRGKGGNIHN